MSTKIKLEGPYATKYKSGYLNTNTEGRKTLALYNNPKDRSSVSYARYLMSVKLGRFLTADEQVDHIDKNKANDSLDNLRVISQKENILYSAERSILKKICCMCCKEFFVEARFARQQTCSRQCGTNLMIKKSLSIR